MFLKLTRFHLIWLTCLMIMFMGCWTRGQTRCPTGRFGQQCKYKCHCDSGRRGDEDDGSCSPGVSCERGWFGPACQYFDLTNDSVVEPSNVENLIIDGDDRTCIQNWNVRTVTVKWEDGISYFFTWMRLHVADASVLHNFTINFNGSTGMTCNEQRTAVIDEKTLDIHCKVDHPIIEVNLHGAGVKRLCSVHISGGRNVALWRNTSQSSTYTYILYRKGVSYDDSASDNAVDGNTSGDFFGDRSCTHTRQEFESWWQVNLQPSAVNRYVIYNRDSEVYRLKGFILQRYGDQTTPLFEHADTSDEQAVYRFNDVSRMGLAERIKIYLPRSDILTLCEVEIYGDSWCEPVRCQNSSCPVYYYGRDCDQKCNCHVKEQCFVSTGTCPSGCAAGFYGEGCGTECPDKTYGINCQQECSANCVDQICDNVNGQCKACPPGKYGDFCDSECTDKTYGIDCQQECSANCVDRVCDDVNGQCKACPPGKHGDFCDSVPYKDKVWNVFLVLDGPNKISNGNFFNSGYLAECQGSGTANYLECCKT